MIFFDTLIVILMFTHFDTDLLCDSFSRKQIIFSLILIDNYFFRLEIYYREIKMTIEPII